MSQMEELLYSAEEHGVRHKMFTEINKIKNEYPNLNLEEIYDKAYKRVMNT
jgi:hypothetical protein